MKVHHRRVVLMLVNGIVGYIVIQFFVSHTESLRGSNSAQVEEHKSILQEEYGDVNTAGQTDTKQEDTLYNEEWWARMAARQEERKLRLRKVCQSLYGRGLMDSRSLASSKTKLRSLIVNEKFRFVYSIVYKVGSTNWERVIVQDAEGHRGVPNQRLYSHRALRWMPKFSEEQVTEYLDRYTKFIFVRNPLSRILSGYRDKFVDHRNGAFASLARQIVKQYRAGEAGGEMSANVTFAEFVEYLVDSAEHRANPHWKPVHAQNMPCEIDFDVVGKLEEAADDIPFVLKTIGMWNVTDYGRGPPRKSTDGDLVREYYSRVPPQLLQELYKVYEPDFHMFGYEMPLYV